MSKRLGEKAMRRKKYTAEATTLKSLNLQQHGTRNTKHETKLNAKLRFDVSGELEQIYVENGQRVKKTCARL
jgi:multidrug efflux pump subunit AcrA (membrane-fusion protein)